MPKWAMELLAFVVIVGGAAPILLIDSEAIRAVLSVLMFVLLMTVLGLIQRRSA